MIILWMMKILEVRDGFIKFEADSSIYLSSFIQIDGMQKSYVAQVIQIKRSGENSIAYAKILFLYDGGLKSYDKTLPSKESLIKEFTFDILSNSINAKEPVIAGITPVKDYDITIDASAFDKKMLISVDDKNENNLIIRNLVKQFNNLGKNAIIIDTLGVINAKKYTAGIDFKLPLDTSSLEFMYEDCLNDATADSKSLIMEIFRDLAEYSRTVPFVPFNALKSIVDDMVDNSHIFKLLVLKNKLAKFDRQGYFAKNKKEVDSIKGILNTKCAILDLSKLDLAFQNRYLAYIYEMMDEVKNTQVFLELSNVVSKKNIKQVFSNANIPTTFITHSKFKYLNDIKNIFDNFIIAPSFTNNSVFGIYNTFLSAMPKGTYLITGEAVNYIPLVSKLTVINNTVKVDIPKPNIENAAEKAAEDVVSYEVLPQEDEITLPEEEKEEEFNIEESPVIERENIIEKAEIAAQSVIENITKQTPDTPPPQELFSDEAESIEEYSEDSDFEEEAAEEPVAEEEIAENIQENTAEAGIEISPDIEPEDLQGTSNGDIIPEPEISEAQDENFEIIEEASDLEDNLPEEEIILPEEAEDSDNQLYEEIQDYDQTYDSASESNDTLQELELEDGSEPVIIEDNANSELEEISEDTIEVPEDIELEEISDTEPEESADINLENTADSAGIEIMPISEDDNFDLDELVELDPDETDENDILVDISDETNEDIDAQIVKDVDKVFTTMKEDEDDISDSDLDFIDELNSDGDEKLLEPTDDAILEEISDESSDDGILEEVQEHRPQDNTANDADILETKKASTPIVPVYDAEIPQEDLVVSDPIQQGDTVFHAKYGSGIVEKMIKYGNKTLFSINFDNIGRRLLDPTLTEIKKS